MIRTSIIIPVWNGAGVIDDCLAAALAQSAHAEIEVICVDNASYDDSAQRIASRFPQVRLIRSPVNLGFAGGVNAGIDAAQGDVLILLNQDCLVQTGWLPALLEGFYAQPSYGIAGCSIFNPDGTLNHAGAHIRRPDAYGIHLTDGAHVTPQLVEYVTGTAFAIKRETWQVVGRFDAGFYPAYFEESDYCFRARRRGIDTVYVPTAHAIHLFTSREWEHEPLRHTANQHYARFRFVAKHFTSAELGDFFPAEVEAIKAEEYFDQVVGRILAARQLLRGIDAIEASRSLDLDERPEPTRRRQLEVGFAQLARRAFAAAHRLGPPPGPEVVSLARPAPEPDAPSDSCFQPELDASPLWKNAVRQLFLLRQKEHELLTRIYFRQPRDHVSESFLARAWRLFLLRPLSYLTGRDDALRREADLLHLTQMEYFESLNRLYVEHLSQLRNKAQSELSDLREWDRRQKQALAQLEAHSRLLELLVDYDFR